MAARKKSSRPKAGAKRAKSARSAARPKARPAAPKPERPPSGGSARGAEAVIYSDLRREAAMRRLLRHSG
jgi:hypothetical protein